ncbi:MAG: A/G-specific adenine glycosylase [Bacteroidetes bacterium]|nr:A/G-specific adenine glycosylase [Bacteroidota bacterium]
MQIYIINLYINSLFLLIVLKPLIIKNIQTEILRWFRAEKRDFLWRGQKDAYKIWLSEIILQQTRVAQGMPYYLKFISAFPDVEALAKASEQEVLKLWQGLGYYSRARNLHTAAKDIVENYNASFPEEFEELKKLKGVGNYTAAAIASISYNKPVAVLDGNVYRVLSRLYEDEIPINENGAEKHYSILANSLLDKKNPGDFNEAMMELGAMICTPQNPKCEECPINRFCKAKENNLTEILPIKLKKLKVRTRYLHYLFIHDAKNLILKKREAGDIWQGLYDFPLEENEGGKVKIFQSLDLDLTTLKKNNLKKITHKLTHQTLEISFYKIELKSIREQIKGDYIFVPFTKLKDYPLPKPIENFLKDFAVL